MRSARRGRWRFGSRPRGWTLCGRDSAYDACMREISHEDFVAEFPAAHGPVFQGISATPMSVDRNASLSGILGALTIRSGATVLLEGIANGSIMVESGAVLYVTGMVKGDLTVLGAACIDGIVAGALRTGDGATVAIDGSVSSRVAAS
jgi:hypothetical protein